MEQYYLKKNIFIRYEPEIEGGTLFIFNKETGEIHEANKIIYIILKCMESKSTMKELIKKLKKTYDIDENAIEYQLERTIKNLLKMKLIASCKSN